jgi:hypothetical protein
MTMSGRSPVSASALRRRSLLFGGVGVAAALAAVGRGTPAAAQPPGPPQIDFDFDTGNFIKTLNSLVDPNSIDDIAPMDVTLQMRVTHLATVGWFDALAPYHPTAVGVHTRIPRRPASESTTNRNKNIAALHASYQAVKAVAAEREPGFRQLMAAFGLNPDDESVDPTSPVGIGNLAGKGVVAARLRDGMNQLGDEGRRYNPKPYRDYTGYRPVNTAYELVHPSRWQPQLTPHRRRNGQVGPGDKGIFEVQHFVTPQLRLVKPYSFRHPARFHVPPPFHTSNHRSRWYRRAVDEVLDASAALTDEQKVIAEFFDNKLLGVGSAGVAVAEAHDDALDLDGWVHVLMTTSTAIFDALIAIWHQKTRFDAVRPFSAIAHLYGSSKVTAWGGVGMGTVDDMPADEWASYLNVGDHPEYPSGSTTLCSAEAQAARRFFDDDVLDWTFPIPAGWTVVEPGITPANDMELRYSNWSEFVADCAISRVWGGVHFSKTVERSVGFGEQFGDLAYEFVQRHINGDVED